MSFIVRSGSGVVVNSETLELLGSGRADVILKSKAETMSAELAENVAQRMRSDGFEAEIMWVG